MQSSRHAPFVLGSVSARLSKWLMRKRTDASQKLRLMNYTHRSFSTHTLTPRVYVQVEIVAGDLVRFSTSVEYMNTGDASCVYVDFANITRVLSPGKYVALMYRDVTLVKVCLRERRLKSWRRGCGHWHLTCCAHSCTMTLTLKLHLVFGFGATSRGLFRSVMFVDDGLLKFVVQEVGPDFVLARAANGGMLGSRKGVDIPDAVMDLPPLSPKDLGTRGRGKGAAS